MDTILNSLARIGDKRVFGVSTEDFLVVAFVMAVSFFARRFIAYRLMQLLQRWVKQTQTHIDDRLLDVIKRPLELAPIVMGLYFSVEILQPKADFRAFMDKGVHSLIVIAVFWALHEAVGPAIAIAQAGAHRIGQMTIDWAARALRIITMILGLMTVLEIWGIKVGALLAGLGLIGVAVALGAQDLFRNLIAGFLIMGERRFDVGDWICAAGVVEGNVERLGFRSTLVRRFDLAPVYVPNAKLVDQSLINFSRMLHRRIYWTISLEYRLTEAQLRRIRDRIERWLTDDPDFLDPPQASLIVRIEGFAPSAIKLLIYTYTQTSNWSEWLGLKERLALAIKAIVEEEGAAFAFPSQTLYVEGVVPDVKDDPALVTTSDVVVGPSKTEAAACARPSKSSVDERKASNRRK